MTSATHRNIVYFADPQKWKSFLRLPLLDEPRGPGPHPQIECPICSGPWQPWAGSRLPCHTKCLLTDEGVSACLHHFRESNGSVQSIADKMGVTVAVIRGTLHHRCGVKMR